MMGEKLTDRGWVECLRCEDMEGCDHCLDGLAPPREMVEAVESVIPATRSWVRQQLARYILLAAARWEREQ